MGEVTMETVAYAKIMLHAAKYPHCAVNGLLLADGSKARSGSKNQDLVIIDAVPLFHHSHNLTPMAEIALTQVEAAAQAENRIIAGYYAACENFRENTVELCPGQKIAEKIVEYFPAAIFVVVDNRKVVQQMDSPAIKIHRYNDGVWKPQDSAKDSSLFSSPDVLDTVSHLLQGSIQRDLVDFDNYLDDLTQDWTNHAIEQLVVSINASNTFDLKDDKDLR